LGVLYVLVGFALLEVSETLVPKFHLRVKFPDGKLIESAKIKLFPFKHCVGLLTTKFTDGLGCTVMVFVIESLQPL